jgi:hypothetical protein
MLSADKGILPPQIDSHQPLGDGLIVSYSSVPEKDLLEFLETGAVCYLSSSTFFKG